MLRSTAAECCLFRVGTCIWRWHCGSADCCVELEIVHWRCARVAGRPANRPHGPHNGRQRRSPTAVTASTRDVDTCKWKSARVRATLDLLSVNTAHATRPPTAHSGSDVRDVREAERNGATGRVRTEQCTRCEDDRCRTRRVSLSRAGPVAVRPLISYRVIGAQ